MTDQTPTTTRDWVTDYVRDHLGARVGRPLLAGLTSFDAALTVQVDGRPPHALEIVHGRLVRAEPAEASEHCHVSMGVAAFRSLVTGRSSPQSLFLTGRLRIRGDLAAALSTAPVLGEFFQTNPVPEAETHA